MSFDPLWPAKSRPEPGHSLRHQACAEWGLPCACARCCPGRPEPTIFKPVANRSEGRPYQPPDGRALSVEQKVAVFRALLPYVNMVPTSVGRSAFLARIAERLHVTGASLREDVGTPRLAPLEPDAFLRWSWQQGPRVKGSTPITLNDIAFELGEDCPPLAQLRRSYVRTAALVRRNQRLGREPWEGIR